MDGLLSHQKKPNKRTFLKIPCPGSDCMNFLKHKWTCEKCQSFLEYGFDGFIYCNCGKGPDTNFKFRCNGRKHGPEFNSFDNNNTLQMFLNEHRPFEEMNILILGETGVGKSTFINAFVNYFTYDSMKAAEASDLLTIVHNSFTITDDLNNHIKITSGPETSNEDIKDGNSATQTSQVYCFPLEDKLLRIIDTPGIGDVRGYKSDQENVENILNTISMLDELHGILILLKPNNSRVTVVFKFCIDELLMHLHTSAANNIMFGFTNTRSTLYRPGDTMPTLKNYLEENENCPIQLSQHTIYCFDSESYRFLAVLKKNIKYGCAVRADFEKSWERSVEETKKLLDHIKTLTPHKVKDTTSLNEARTSILQLTKPLAEITKQIQLNTEKHKRQIDDLNRTKARGQALLPKLNIKRWNLVQVSIDYARTVCTNVRCTCDSDFNSAKEREYTTTCHDHCYVSGVTVETVNDPRLFHCSAIGDNGYCARDNCGHHYTEHIHVMYLNKQKEVDAIDADVQKQIAMLGSEEEQKQAVKNQLEKLKHEYESEQLKVEHAAALFGCFLSKNAIKPVSDARIDYLDHFIRHEEQLVSHRAEDRTTLDFLLNAKAVYQEEMEVIKRSIESGSAVHLLDPATISQTIKELYKLKHYGQMIKDMRDAGVNAIRHHYGEHMIPIVRKSGLRTTVPWSSSSHAKGTGGSANTIGHHYGENNRNDHAGKSSGESQGWWRWFRGKFRSSRESEEFGVSEKDEDHVKVGDPANTLLHYFFYFLQLDEQ